MRGWQCCMGGLQMANGVCCGAVQFWLAVAAADSLIVRIRAGQHYRGAACLGFVVADEALRLGGAVWREIMRPAEADGLVPELRRTWKGPGADAGVDRVADRAALVGEIGIVERIADRPRCLWWRIACRSRWGEGGCP